MAGTTLSRTLLAPLLLACSCAWAATPISSTDPLAAIDLNRNAIIADIVQGFEGDRNALAKRLAGLRADRLLAVSLASTRESLETILGEAEKARDSAMSRTSAKVLGSATADLVYTPLTPCRLIDTRGFGAPIQGGAFAPNARRSYAPNGLCSLPTSGVATILISFTTENLTPNSGGYLAILAPATPVTASVDVFNLGAEWSASNTAVATGSAAQFDVLVAVANAHVVIDVLGYFAPPQGGAVTSLTAGTGLTGGTITSTGTVGIASGFQLPQVCTNGQVATSNGAGAWTCATPVVTGGTVTAVSASAPLASSGGITPNISLSGALPVANGGTGQSTVATNAIVYGQGTAATATLPVGQSGEVLVGTAAAPAWSGSPSLSGNLTLRDSSATLGNINKPGGTFLHNFGASNTFLGVGAGNFAMTGPDNTAIGTGALQGNTSGNSNTALGVNALAVNTSGTNNTATGWNALASNTIGNFNTALGRAALFHNTTGNFNAAGGLSALAFNTTGSSNTAFGYDALFSNTTSSNNTATGYLALSANTTGQANTASGAFALSSNTTASFSTAFGASALQNSTGFANTAIGSEALLGNTTGQQNVAIGGDALSSNTTGNFNIAVGNVAATQMTGASGNIAIGVDALTNSVTGDFNIAIGHLAGLQLDGGSNNITIANGGVTAESGAIRIGTVGTHTSAFIAGIRGVTTALAAVPVLVDTDGQLGTVSSSRRVKDDIADMDAASSALMKLRPVTFHYKSDQSPTGRTLQYGLIAEEVSEVYPGLVAHSADGQVETVMYQFLPTMLLNEVQKLRRDFEAQRAEIAALKQRLNERAAPRTP